MFKEIGYFKDYYVNGKYIGTKNHVEKDRDTFGFFGKKSETLNEKLTLSNKKIIKQGTIVQTELQILNSQKL